MVAKSTRGRERLPNLDDDDKGSEDGEDGGGTADFQEKQLAWLEKLERALSRCSKCGSDIICRLTSLQTTAV